MKQTIIPGKVPPVWSAEAFYTKAIRYAEKMAASGTETWDHALWSGLSLELLARAALANISPTLLADPVKWNNLLNALGHPPTEAKFLPRSIGAQEVLLRLRNLLPAFDQELESFCLIHMGRRNTELHSGDLPYDGVHGSRWHGQYYRACVVLLESMGYALEDFIGAELAKICHKEIAAAADDAAKAVLGELEAHRKLWAGKPAEERTQLAGQSSAWATRQSGHRVDCPACGSNALVVGEAIGSPKQRLADNEITETQEHLPHLFQCIACGFKIVGLSRLLVVGLGDRYTKTQVFDAAEYYAPEDPYLGFDDDNNERY